MKALLLAALVACGAPGSPPAPPPRAAVEPAPPRASYAIDGRPVDGATYTAFAARLHEVPNTWRCAETSDGGETSYRGTDAAGTVWIVTTESSSATGARSTARRAQ